MSNDEATAKTDKLQRLAAEAQIVAETTVDPNRKRALSVIALKYKRLAEFVRSDHPLRHVRRAAGKSTVSST